MSATMDRAPELLHPDHRIHGEVSKGFEGVRDAFEENFSRHNELGAACCVYRDGEKVVDLWGGVRNKVTGEPWEADTMVLVFSATKGLAAMVMALAHSRGLLDYEERVCTYWPEFGQNGKENITVRQLLAHQAGLFAFDERVDKGVVADLDSLAEIMARQTPEWYPGERQAYHAISLGFYEGELLRRIDPRRRTLGQFFHDEIAEPLGADIYIRLPEDIPNTKLATLDKPKTRQLVFGGLPFRLLITSMNPRSPIFRALLKPNPGPWVPLDDERIYARNLEVPSGGGVGSARGIARVYDAFATGGHELGLRSETLDALSAPAIPPVHGFWDEGLKREVQFSLGFFRPSSKWPFARPGAFGSPGSGGAFGYADPERRLAYAYAPNRMGPNVVTDVRDEALRAALDSAIS
jgi:CubicO group peptidase (beta-lactamase class C family)